MQTRHNGCGDGKGHNSNSTHIFHLRTEDNPAHSTWLVKKNNKYAWQMHNEMLIVMTLEVLRDVVASLQLRPLYSIMADETTDSSNREQVVIFLRWVDNSLKAHEEFIELQQVDRIDAATITFTTKDVLHRMNLRLTGARGQCYGGCSILSGAKTSVATNIKSD